MAETVDDLTINYTDNGVLVRKELDKHVLSKGAWSTIMYKYQEWNRQKEEYGPIKYMINRYQKTAGQYKQRSKFAISSIAQAENIISVLGKWINEDKTE